MKSGDVAWRHASRSRELTQVDRWASEMYTIARQLENALDRQTVQYINEYRYNDL